jgi:cyclic-di-GMP phosphodiesterase TipF (flagellum assembly factor)
MRQSTQLLLIVSYLLIGLAVAIIPSGLGYLDHDDANLIGVIVFFSILHGHTLMRLNGKRGVDEERIEKLESKTTFLRSDLERTRRVVDGQTQKAATKEGLVAELKVLQTLIHQVVAREKKRSEEEASQAQAATPVEAPIEDAVVTSDNDNPPLDLETDQALAEDDTSSDLYLTSETRSIEHAKKFKDTKTAAQDGGLIRVVGDEDQLFSVIQGALSENRVDLYIQPIMALPDRKIAHYECLSRVRDEHGNIILPRQYLKLAEKEGFIGTIDNLLLFRLIQLARKIGPRKPDVRFFCNISKYSMMDEEFFPQFVDFMMSHEEFTKRFVFEIGQNDYMSLDDKVKDQLASLGRRGFGFSMDHMHDLNIDYRELGRNHFRFIKYDADPLLRDNEHDINALKLELRRNGMELIASRLESAALMTDAIDAGVDLAQGYHFGEPESAADIDRHGI